MYEPEAFCDRCGYTEQVASRDGAILIEEIRHLTMEGWDCEDSREWFCPTCARLRKIASVAVLPTTRERDRERVRDAIANALQNAPVAHTDGFGPLVDAAANAACVAMGLNPVRPSDVESLPVGRREQVSAKWAKNPVPESCACQRCGRRDGLDAVVPDAAWEAITGRTNGSGILCLWCIDALSNSDADREHINQLCADNDVLVREVETAWDIIANVSGGDWTKQSPEWQEAARRWEREYAGGLR